MLVPLDFWNLLQPHMLKVCPTCGGTGRHPNVPVPCEHCDGKAWVPTPEGRELLEVLGDRPIPVRSGGVS